jgi:hypothetical protein
MHHEIVTNARFVLNLEALRGRSNPSFFPSRKWETQNLRDVRRSTDLGTISDFVATRRAIFASRAYDLDNFYLTQF